MAERVKVTLEVGGKTFAEEFTYFAYSEAVFSGRLTQSVVDAVRFTMDREIGRHGLREVRN